MTFRFANVQGRSALVDADGRWFDASRLSQGVISADPMSGWLQQDELHRTSATISDAVPDGAMSDADVRPPIPSPRSIFAVGLNYRSHADESGMDPFEQSPTGVRTRVSTLRGCQRAIRLPAEMGIELGVFPFIGWRHFALFFNLSRPKYGRSFRGRRHCSVPVSVSCRWVPCSWIGYRT